MATKVEQSHRTLTHCVICFALQCNSIISTWGHEDRSCPMTTMHVKLIMGQLMALVTCRPNLCGSEKCVARFTTTKLIFAAIWSEAINAVIISIMTPPISRPVLHTVSAASSTNVSTLMITVTEETKAIEEGNGEMVWPGRKMVQLGRKMVQLGRKMVQLGKKMVQSGKNETCDSRPSAPEGPGRKKRRSPRLDAPGEPWRSMRSPRPGAPGVQGRKRCTALDSVLLGYRGEKDAQPLTQCSWGTSEENARPSARCSIGGPGRRTRCSWGTREENDVQPSTGSSRSSLATEQGIKTDHPWIYIRNNILE